MITGRYLRTALAECKENAVVWCWQFKQSKQNAPLKPKYISPRKKPQKQPHSIPLKEGVNIGEEVTKKYCKSASALADKKTHPMEQRQSHLIPEACELLVLLMFPVTAGNRPGLSKGQGWPLGRPTRQMTIMGCKDNGAAHKAAPSKPPAWLCTNGRDPGPNGKRFVCRGPLPEDD